MCEDDEQLLKLSEVAALTQTPIGTVRRWVYEQRLPVERVGPFVLKHVRVRRGVLRELFPEMFHDERL